MITPSPYNICLEGNTLKIGFTGLASNDRLVQEVDKLLHQLESLGQLRGQLLKINGPASMPIAFVLAHHLAHLYGAIAINDPKLAEAEHDRYVVAITHNPQYQLGQVI